MLQLAIVLGIAGAVLSFYLLNNLFGAVIFILAYTALIILFDQMFKLIQNMKLEKKIVTDLKNEELRYFTGLKQVYIRFAQRTGAIVGVLPFKFLDQYKVFIRNLVFRSGIKPAFKAETVLGLQILNFLLTLVLAPLFTLGLNYSAGMNFPPLFVGILGALLAFYMPIMNYRSARSAREKAIFRQLPDVLDLLNLSVRAGMDFSAALDRVISVEAGPLIDEFSIAQQEVRMGKSREEAFTALTNRIDYKPLGNVMRSVILALKMGVSLAPTLDTLSEDYKTEMAVHAEKMGAEAPIKMLGPLLVFIFPTIFLVIFAPIALPFIIKQ